MAQPLWRTRDVPMMVIANHPQLAEHVRPFGVPFVHIPATRDIRTEAEQRQLLLLSGNVDLGILARCMQILTPTFLDAVGCPLINIHRSFPPAFTGAAPLPAGTRTWCQAGGCRRPRRPHPYRRRSDGSVPMSSARRPHARCSGTARTGLSCTPTGRSFSDDGTLRSLWIWCPPRRFRRHSLPGTQGSQRNPGCRSRSTASTASTASTSNHRAWSENSAATVTDTSSPAAGATEEIDHPAADHAALSASPTPATSRAAASTSPGATTSNDILTLLGEESYARVNSKNRQ